MLFLLGNYVLPCEPSAPQGLDMSNRGQRPISVNLTPQVVGIQVSLTAITGPEGRQGVAHGVSRGTEEPPLGYLSPGGAAEAPPRDLSPLPGL